ncbi:MAG: WYL domain-containing protein [Lachnospiraceae bacterium]|nr:WYL domain-containing protein [Lachnospiraceae bacterium]
MTEKYKIYVPEEMRTRLMNDAELFDYAKKDGSVNLNAFLKDLLVNYFDEYRTRKAALHDAILTDLNAYPSINKRDAAAIAEKILNTYARNQEFDTVRDCAITLTVSGHSQDVMSTIENNLLTDVSLSQYVNDLFASYLSIARSQREKIIFRDVYETLENAIRKNNIITFTSTSASAGSVFTVKPYLIAVSKEEQCNYLLCQDKSSRFTRTFRVSRIRALYTTQETFRPNKDVARELKEIAIRNPQSAAKNIDATVLLTDRGIAKFRVIVKNRPEVLKRDGNTFYFHWPRIPLEDYFSRFGKDAIILSPRDSHDHMITFYKNALSAYEEQ